MAVQSTAWEQVSEKFEALGEHLRDRFDEVGADATADREAFEKSLRALASALEDTLASAGRAVRDPVLRQDLSGLAASLREALMSTFTGAGELRERIAAPVRRGRAAVSSRTGRSVKEAATTATTAAGRAAGRAASAATTATSAAASAAKATGARTVSRGKAATGTAAPTATPRKTTARTTTARTATARKTTARKATPRTTTG